METELLKGTDHNTLKVVFLGFGQDLTPFSSLNLSSDTFFVYDYEDDSADFSVIYKYKKYEVIAWSLGVMMADIFVSKMEKKPWKMTALNGTPFGINSEKGVDAALYKATLDNLSEETHKKMENFSVTLNSLSKNFSDQQEHIRETKNEFKTSLDEYMSKIDDALGRLPIEEIKKFFGEPNDEISETENTEIRSIKDYENEINALKKRVGKLEKHFGKGKKLSGKSSAKNSIVSGKKDKVSKKEPTSAIPQLSDFKYTEVSEQFQNL